MGGDTTLNTQKEVIKFERLIDMKYIKRDIIIVFFFTMSFIVIGLFENNLFLPNDGFGLLEHINIWLFLAANAIIPIAISIIYKQIERDVDLTTRIGFKENFCMIAKLKFTTVLFNFFTAVGFCCFIANSLQNAKIINNLPFDYWDSVNYMGSYIASRFYKFYLFAYFIPHILIYVYVSVKALSKSIVIKDEEMDEYPIKNYEQLNALCNYGLNLLVVMCMAFILISIGIYFIHNRLDVISTTSIIVALVATLVCLHMYVMLVNSFRVSIIKYMKTNINDINCELAKIHKYVVNYQYGEKSKNELEVYLHQEKYLSKIKKRIEKLNKYPFVIKAIITSFSPIIPALFKIVFQFLKDSSKLDILTTIL